MQKRVNRETLIAWKTLIRGKIELHEKFER